ncbi:MAG: MmcQ/YjbR family DNA-binding protein [Pseudolysinimonas sp.]
MAANWDDVSRLALALPDVLELPDGNGLKWEVHRRHFAWERPLRKRDLEDLGEGAPTGPILGLRVADLDEKRGLIGSSPGVFFTIPHFANYPAVPALLEHIDIQQLEEVLTDAWLCRAPKGLAATWLAEHGLE